MSRRITRTPNPFRVGATFHRDPSPGEMESVEMALPSTGSHRTQVEELMREHSEGLTMHEVAELLGWNSRDNVNPRMQELKRDELVYKTGATRDTGLGGRADVWRHTAFLTATARAELNAPIAIPRSTPAVKNPASDTSGRSKNTRGASSTGTGRPSPEQMARARDRIAARNAAAANTA